MKIKFAFLLVVLAIAVEFSACTHSNIPKVVIVQDKPQEWADALKLGFYDGISEAGYDVSKDLVVIPRSANGDPTALSQLEQNVSRGDYKVIYTLGTQTSQDILQLTKSKNIIFGAVTDPVSSHLYKNNLQTPAGNITGTQDLWPYPAQFTLIKRLLPNIKKIGVVYNSSEINSQVSIHYIGEECKKRNIQLVERTVTAESEIQTAVAALLNEKIELLFIPADNTAQTSANTILAQCTKNKIPVFTGISGIVESGAIATVGTNYYELGKINAKQALQIIFKDKLAKDIPVAVADKGDIYLNLKTAKALGISIPQDVADKAIKKYE
ncbi:MAG: ABC transporter substrate-binding protein [Bacteroidetes bacterium]|nr:ABC transporter substrate-binding protein [Bacteroidota bacterium]